MAKRHKDGNKGHSWLLWLGDYTSGGGLNFDDGREIKIDGQDHHWNDPHEGGTKYSIVIFRSDKKPKTNHLNELKKKKAEKGEGRERRRLTINKFWRTNQRYIWDTPSCVADGISSVALGP